MDEYPPGVRAPGEGYTGPIADPEKAVRGYMEFMAETGGLGRFDPDPYAPVKAYLSAKDVWENPGKYAGYPQAETAFVRVAETSSSGRATAASDQTAIEPLDSFRQSGISSKFPDPQPDSPGYTASVPSRKASQNGPFLEDLPVLRDPFSVLLHYVRGSRAPVQYPFSEIDTSEVRAIHFRKVREFLNSRRVGEFEVREYMGFATSGFTSAAFVGRISLLLEGSLKIRKDESYNFTGVLTAHPDRYRFYQSDSRTVIGEASTRAGELLPGAPFWVIITGSKNMVEDGRR